MLRILGKNFWSLQFVRSDRWGSLYLSVFCKRRSRGFVSFLKSNQNPLIPQLQTSHLRHAYTNVYKLYAYIFTSPLSLSLFTFVNIYIIYIYTWYEWTENDKRNLVALLWFALKPYKLQLGLHHERDLYLTNKTGTITGIKRDSHGRKFDWLERAVWSEIWGAEHFQHFKASHVSQALVAYHPRQKQLSYGPSTGIAVAEILLVSKTSGRFIPKT